jgi:hypothetical protein
VSPTHWAFRNGRRVCQTQCGTPHLREVAGHVLDFEQPPLVLTELLAVLEAVPRDLWNVYRSATKL